MKTRTENLISELLFREGKSRLARTELDVLRVLVINAGSSWREELTQDLTLLRAFKRESGEIDEGEVDGALGELKRSGLLRAEKRIRGMMDGPREDWLISLLDLSAVRNAFSGDRVLTRYMYERMR